jgi:hypothetical protein
LRASISKNRQSHSVTDVLSHQIFETLYTIDAKIKLIEKALKVLDEPKWYEEFIKHLSPEIRKRGRERNKIVHNEWGVCEAYPHALILSSREGVTVYEMRDFRDLSTRTRKLGSNLLSFVSALPQSRIKLQRRVNHND